MRNREVGTKHVFAGGTRLVSKLVKAPNVVDLDGDGIPDDIPNGCSEPWGWTNGNGGQGNANGICNGNAGGNGNGNGGSGPAVFEKDQYYYHPDHLGSSSYVTDLDGEIFQHLEYFPFGETWVEEHSNTQRTPYLLTSKELDEETGLYYFGARYYDPRTSIWQSPDPILAVYLGGEGSGGGVFVPANLNLFGYVQNRPLLLVDPDGNQSRGGPSQPNYSQNPLWQLNNAQIVNLTAQIRTYNPNYSTIQNRPESVSPREQGRTIRGLQRTLQREQWSSRMAQEALYGCVPSPHGFPGGHNAQRVAAVSFMRGINNDLRSAGYRDSIAMLQGSSVTGTNYRTGEAFRGLGVQGPTLRTGPNLSQSLRPSDRDVALAGPSLYARAEALGIQTIGLGANARTRPLTARQMGQLGLSGLYSRAQSESGGHPVNFMIYRDPAGAYARSPSWLGNE